MHRSFGLRLRALRWLALSAVGVLVPMSGGPATPVVVQPAVVAGPVAWLLSASADLGPARTGQVMLTVALRDVSRPRTLVDWAARHGLSVNWQPDEDWAYVAGAPANVADAFGVTVHDYRSRSGQVFFASARQPRVPAPVRAEVRALGRILGYSAVHRAKPPGIALDVPRGGLKPPQLLKTYNAGPLAAAGFTGKGATIVFFEIDGYRQQDLDTFADKSGLPRFTPILIGGQPGKPGGETPMDLEVAHAIAPDAQLVVINALKAFGGANNYAQVAQMFRFADQQFPGAVWSSSIGFGCDRMGDPTALAADLAPVQSALVAAELHGTSAFTASGDTAGYECAFFHGDWSAPPEQSNQGVDAVASLPAMTDVGGTTLSTDKTGAWIAEQAWFESQVSLGTGGGVSAVFDRPSWQNTVSSPWDATHRLTPDVAADADPATGVKIYYDGKWWAGGGTSQSAPIWAALTVLMNQFLVANGGHPVGDINPLLYQVAASRARPAFHDVLLGGNAIYGAAPGYDLVTGLGTPDVDNLVHDILDIQQGGRP